jgi:hypothetical protein
LDVRTLGCGNRRPTRSWLGEFFARTSSRSQWFPRAASDNHTTHSFLVQQAALPSTGADWHSNYMSLVLGQQYNFSPTWVGSFTFDASYLYMTEAQNSNLGFALAFPFRSTSQTISGFETLGDEQSGGSERRSNHPG